MYLSRPVSGLPKYARLSFCELVYLFSVVDATVLHLFIEHDAMETHIGADRLHKRTIMFMRLGNDAFTVSETMAHSVGHGAVLGEVSDYGTVFAPTAPLLRDFDLLFHCDGL